MGELFKFLGWGLFNVYNDGENAQQGGGCLLLTILLVGGGLIYLILAFLNSDLISDSARIIIAKVLQVLLIPLLIFCIYKFIKYSIQAAKEK